MTQPTEQEPNMQGAAPQHGVRRNARLPKPTGEPFDAADTHKQAKQLYPNVLARLAE